MQQMKRVLVLIIVLLLIGGAGYYYLRNNTSILNPTPTPAPTQTAQTSPIQEISDSPSSFCAPIQLEAGIEPEVAAGNYYGAITIKNISQTACQVVGNNTLTVGYPVSVTNFKTVSKREPTTPVFTLAPNQTMYALIHFPNGPQCSSEATQVDAMVSYKISQNDLVTFKPTMGSTVSIPSCGKASEITTIDLYPFSYKEVTP
jgi:hypothetical protein